MRLRLQRETFTRDSTIGSLYVDDVFNCYTLEDCERYGAPKVPGATAIPAGTYAVVIDFSVHFQRDMPHVLNVPGFEGIRIHYGNTSADTEGCILVGTERGHDVVRNSRDAYAPLFGLLHVALTTGAVSLVIITGTPP